MWVIPFIFWGFMLSSWIEPYLPNILIKNYPNSPDYISFIFITCVLFYIYFLRPMFKEMNGTKRIAFGKYKGRKWEDIPTDYLKWVADTYNNFNEASALRELRKRKKNKTSEFEKKCHPYESTILGIIEGKRKCWKCKKSTDLIALKLYSNINEDDEYSITPKVEHFIQYLPESIINTIQEKYPFFQYRYSKTADITYLANSCINCYALQGDWQQHEEPDGAFFDSYKMKCNQYMVLNNGNINYSKFPHK